MNQNNIEQYPAGKSVLLHLLPGFLIGVCYFLLVPVARQLGYPSIAALMISVAVVLVPFELGYLFYQGRKATGRFSLQDVVEYRNRLPVGQLSALGTRAFYGPCRPLHCDATCGCIPA